MKALEDVEEVDSKRKKVAIEVRYLEEKLSEVLDTYEYDKTIFGERLIEEEKVDVDPEEAH